MEVNIDEFFENDSNYIKDQKDKKGLQSYKKRRKEKTKSAKISHHKCDVECGSNNDLQCTISNLKFNNAISCCETSLRSLVYDLNNLETLYVDQPLTVKLKKVCLKNDRVFYLMMTLTLIIIVLSLIRTVFSAAPAPAVDRD